MATEKVITAMSGGVDSTASAALLMEKGYHVEGVFMITHDEAEQAQAEAEEMAERLVIKLHILDLRTDFEDILDYFCAEYKGGRTPNPCVYCNRHIKFGKLWDFAMEKGVDYLATGHYAKIIHLNNESRLYETNTKEKDQSYVLSMMKRNVLDHVLVPLGEFTKNEVSEKINELGLHLENREESQEICFIPDDDYISKLESLCPDVGKTGDIVDSEGNVLGKHEGIHRYTIGQRRGLGVAMGVPYYVTKLDAEKNRVVLGPKDEVMSNRFTVSKVNWLVDRPKESFEAKVKIRYNDRGHKAIVKPEGNTALIEYEKKKSAITPGQLAVFYVKDNIGYRIFGSGWINDIIE